MERSPALADDNVYARFGKHHGLRLRMLNSLYDTAVSLQNSEQPPGEKQWRVGLKAIRQLSDAHRRFLPRIWPSTATLLHKRAKLEHYLANPEALAVAEETRYLLRTLQYPEERVQDACRIVYEAEAEMQQQHRRSLGC
jgi:hypothetical protein